MLVGLEIGIATTENSMEAPPKSKKKKKKKKRTNISPNNPTPWHIPGENQN